MTQSFKDTIQNQDTKVRKKRRGFDFYIKMVNRLIVLAIIATSVYYVISINDLSIKGFVLADLRMKTNELNKENKEIELSVMELESFDNISKRAVGLKMVKVDKIDYISIAPDTVALK